MPPRKRRIRVVLDTNVLIGQLLSKTRNSSNARVYDLWLKQRILQLIISQPVLNEYIEVLERLGVSAANIDRFQQRLATGPTVSLIGLGKRFAISRDVDDDVLLATAQAGRADYLVSNDRDLLDIPTHARREFSFEIVSPPRLLSLLDI